MLRFAAAFGLVNLVNDKRVTRWAITRIINQRLDSVRFRTIILDYTLTHIDHFPLDQCYWDFKEN